MRRRIVWVVTLSVLLSLGAASWIAVLVITTDRDTDLAGRVGGLAPAFARQLQSRLQMANAMVQYLSAGDAGGDGAALRQRVLASDTFGGVLLVPWLPNVPDAEDTDDSSLVSDASVPGFSTSERLTLSGGQSLLRVVPKATGGMSIYLAHMVSTAGLRQVAYFELAPNWFWQGADQTADNTASQTAIAVVDTAGRIIYRGGELPLDAFRKFAVMPVDEHDPLHAVQRDWLQDDTSWRAAVVRLDFASATHLQAMPWNVVCYVRLSDARPMLGSFVLLMLPMLLLAVACAGFVSWFLGRRWEPVLARLNCFAHGHAGGQISTCRYRRGGRLAARRRAELQSGTGRGRAAHRRTAAPGADRPAAAREHGRGAGARCRAAAHLCRDRQRTWPPCC